MEWWWHYTNQCQFSYANQTMKARKHRGLFVESMETMRNIPATLDAVAEYFEVPANTLTFEKGRVFDDREGWNSEYWYVMSNGGVFGMISEEIT